MLKSIRIKNYSRRAGLLQAHRLPHPRRHRRPRHLGQRLRPQVPAGARMARTPPPRALAPALHPHQHQLGQPRRMLVLDPGAQSTQEPSIQLRRRPPTRHRRLGPALEPRPPAPQMDQTSPTRHRQSQTSPNRPTPRNQTRDRPLGRALGRRGTPAHSHLAWLGSRAWLGSTMARHGCARHHKRDSPDRNRVIR